MSEINQMEAIKLDVELHNLQIPLNEEQEPEVSQINQMEVTQLVAEVPCKQKGEEKDSEASQKHQTEETQLDAEVQNLQNLSNKEQDTEVYQINQMEATQLAEEVQNLQILSNEEQELDVSQINQRASTQLAAEVPNLQTLLTEERNSEVSKTNQMEATQLSVEVPHLQTPFNEERNSVASQINQMEATQLSVDVPHLRTPVKREIKGETIQGSSHKSQFVATRCTRSKSAPDWTVNEMLILVSEIAAVEGDCMKALPSHQKWKMIADNCNALEVARNLNQCHRKWDSLLMEYKKIKEWESQPGIDSYWSLESAKRKELGLPSSFDDELFRSIDDLVRAQEDRSDTELEGDSQSEAEVLNVIMDSGSKKHKRRRKSSIEDKEHVMTVKLCESTELIHAILKGDLKEITEHDLRNVHHSEFVRRQGDELIKVLGSVVTALDQLSDSIQ